MDKEAKRFIWYTLDFHLHAFDLSGFRHPEAVDKNFHDKSFSVKYDYLKLLQGEIHSYYIGMNKELLDREERERTEQIISAVRNSMFSAKSIKDSHGDIDQFRNSSSNTKFQVYKSTQREVEEFYRLLTECLTRPSQAAIFEDIVALYNRVQNGYAAESRNYTGRRPTIN